MDKTTEERAARMPTYTFLQQRCPSRAFSVLLTTTPPQRTECPRASVFLLWMKSRLSDSGVMEAVRVLPAPASSSDGRKEGKMRMKEAKCTKKLKKGIKHKRILVLRFFFVILESSFFLMYMFGTSSCPFSPFLPNMRIVPHFVRSSRTASPHWADIVDWSLCGLESDRRRLNSLHGSIGKLSREARLSNRHYPKWSNCRGTAVVFLRISSATLTNSTRMGSSNFYGESNSLVIKT
jgi:hypothetical protein